MVFRILADVVVIVHVAFLLFVTFGGVLVLRRPWLFALHVPAVVWGVLIELAGWVCPLTPLENRFRRLGGEAGYPGGFVEHYLIPVLYPPGLTRSQQVWLGVFVGVLNLTLYGILVYRRVARTNGPQELVGEGPSVQEKEGRTE